MMELSYDEFFARAMSRDSVEGAAYPYQRALATEAELPELVCVPTGCGKTAALVLAWLWRRLLHPDGDIRARTPRRLVYCLPMRTLVEQTARDVRGWTRDLSKADLIKKDVSVHVLMGGEANDDWDLYPEREAVLVGTQDMLLSRALNRGYAASRARWPMQFGLLNTDSLWIFDEIQLMGAGLATTAQLEAFRRSFSKEASPRCRSIWMSATLQPDWLKTVDFDPRTLKEAAHLTREDFEHPEIEKRWNATKSLHKATSPMGAPGQLAKEILDAHLPGTRTIIVVNTVHRACELFNALRRSFRSAKGRGTEAEEQPALLLLHSRFRPGDRRKKIEMALGQPTGGGTIVVSTQVIEAGVDVSARAMFTELAPWASLVQRFGRCNRDGSEPDVRVSWMDLPSAAKDVEKLAPPYEIDFLRASARRLADLDDVGLRPLKEVDVHLLFRHGHVLRRKDLLDLFDTTPDLAGSDIDIDRFVRDVEESDVCVVWREWPRPNGREPPPDDTLSPRRDELCRAPIGDFRDFAKKHPGLVWRWVFRDGEWESISKDSVVPGQLFVVHSNAGGYDPDRGWDPKCRKRVEPVPPGIEEGDVNRSPASTEDETQSRIGVWQSIAEHTDDVCTQVDDIARSLPIANREADVLRVAARWHDFGKAHEAFLAKLKPGALESPNALRCIAGNHHLAKAPDTAWVRGRNTNEKYRRHFRHELASALAVLDPRNRQIRDDVRDLVAYLVAAHHGKVRLSIRSLPGEQRPPAADHDPARARRFARGVWDGDRIPANDLGGGVIAGEVELSLEMMELGLCEEPPFAGQPSWVERTLRLRDEMGPFWLAYLEALLRAADVRASRAAEGECRGEALEVPHG